MKGYKALYKVLTAKNGFQFKIGKQYIIDGNLEICKNGFHFCQNIIDVFGYWKFDKENTVVCEVEASGKIVQEGTKYCAEKITLIRILDWKEIENVINADNAGIRNSGYRNSGDYNSGSYNSGSYNSGYSNSGSYNSGYYNSGFFNTNEPTVRLFNTDSGLTFKEFYKLGIDFRNLENSKEIITSLPNYDAEIFYQCTGINWRNEK